MALYQLIYWNPHAVVVLSHTQVVDAEALKNEAQGAASDAAQVPPTNLLSTLLTFTSFILNDLCTCAALARARAASALNT